MNQDTGKRGAGNWIDWLPDEIAKALGDGETIVFEHPDPPEHVRRLMDALGVPIVSGE